MKRRDGAAVGLELRSVERRLFSEDPGTDGAAPVPSHRVELEIDHLGGDRVPAAAPHHQPIDDPLERSLAVVDGERLLALEARFGRPGGQVVGDKPLRSPWSRCRQD